MASLRAIADSVRQAEQGLMLGGGKSGTERQRKLGRLPVRERLSILLDADRPFLELGLWAAYQMYPEWGEVPAAGVV
ncbi:MAG: acyl-CoA carboxylase subunit beta, partial [Pirellula sp.]